MKKLSFLSLYFIILSCTKDNYTAPPSSATKDIASGYTGSYMVYEKAYDLLTDQLLSQSEFNGKVYRDVEYIQNLPSGMTEEDSLNVVAFDQESRPTPYPAWAPPGREGYTAAGIMTYKFYSFNGQDSLMGVPGTTSDGWIISKDSLAINYAFGAGTATYIVNQIWVKNK
jgi:hypothetical protein